MEYFNSRGKFRAVPALKEREGLGLKHIAKLLSVIREFK